MRPAQQYRRPTAALLTLADMQRRGPELAVSQRFHQAEQEPAPASSNRILLRRFRLLTGQPRPLKCSYVATMWPSVPPAPARRRACAAPPPAGAKPTSCVWCPSTQPAVTANSPEAASTLGSATAGQEQEENEPLEADAGELVTEEEGTYPAYLAFPALFFGHFEWIWGEQWGST